MKFNLSTFVKYLKRANFVLAAFFLILILIAGVNLGVLTAHADTQNLQINEGGTFPVTESRAGEGISSDGVFRSTFRFSEQAWIQAGNAPRDISFPLRYAMYRCPEGNGQGQYQNCTTDSTAEFGTVTVSLNAGNNYTQDHTFSIQQIGAVPCGSFQSDIAVNHAVPGTEGGYLDGAVLLTGKDLGPNCNTTASPSPSPSVSPSPSPSPSVSPSPSPSASPSPKVSPSPKPSSSPSNIQCPVGKIGKVVDSTVVCVAQNQEQNQNQTQNNNQNQTVNQNVVATGGNSSSSSSSSSSVNVTVNNPTPSATPTPTPSTTTVTVVKTSVPQVVSQTKGDVTELPKTGLPLAALALGGLLPAGFGIKRFAKKDQTKESANSIWMERQLIS